MEIALLYATEFCKRDSVNVYNFCKGDVCEENQNFANH